MKGCKKKNLTPIGVSPLKKQDLCRTTRGRGRPVESASYIQALPYVYASHLAKSTRCVVGESFQLMGSTGSAM